MNDLIRISVVIPTINEQESIADCVDSVLAAGADQIIVADGGSSDRTFELARERGCEIVASPAGRAIQQNAGARKANGDILLFLHSDNRLGTEACQQIRTAFADDPSLQWGGFIQRIGSWNPLYRLIEWGNMWRAMARGFIYGDQCIFVRRNLFLESDGFPDVPFMEDYILSKRLKGSSRQILRGPVRVSPRRWQKNGLIRQTICNWSIIRAYENGTPLDELVKEYHRHDHCHHDSSEHGASERNSHEHDLPERDSPERRSAG